MRKLSLKTYSMYTLKRLNGENSFKVSKMVEDVDTENHRLLAPLLCWLYLNDLSLKKEDELQFYLNDMRNLYPHTSEDNALLYLKESNNLDLNKYAKSFESENKRRDENTVKNNYRLVFKKMQKEYNITSYKLCKMANINPGNFNAFYNHNQNDKLSLKKCKILFAKLCKETFTSQPTENDQLAKI